MRVTIKRHERESGLRRLWNGERGAAIRIDGKQVGHIGFARGYLSQKSGWYFVVGGAYGLLHTNTSNEPLATYDEAKAAAIAYVKKHARATELPGGDKEGP